MSLPYRVAIIAGVSALAAIVASVTVGPDAALTLLLIAAAGGPIAVGAAVVGRLRCERIPVLSLVGGAIVGPAIAIAGHAVVAAFAYFFVLGFADAATTVLDELQTDPQLIEALRSPWVLLLLIDLAVVAPLTEEVGKGLGAAFGRPGTRRMAFLAGVLAGVGFAIIENLMYVGLGGFFGGAWPEIALHRVIGVAVHPLASGLVVLGWWDWRHGRKPWAMLRGFLAGAGVHALWNGSIVALSVVEIAFDVSLTDERLATAGFGFMVALGVILAGALWATTVAVAADRDPVDAIDFKDARAVAAWTLLTAAVLVPATIIIVAFPDFYFG